MEKKVSRWASRLLMVVLLIFLYNSGNFGKGLTLFFCALVALFAIAAELTRKNKREE